MTGTLPTRFDERAEGTETVTLIPMGAARLRISAFPQADIVKSKPGCAEQAMMPR